MSVHSNVNDKSVNSKSHDLNSKAPVLGRIGNLETRLVRSTAEIREAQLLRYKVFYEEMQAKPSAEAQMLKRDRDALDRYCDHLLVIDNENSSARVVGTYRMMLQSQAQAAGQFYTQSEFELAPLLKTFPDARFLELGRSCILPEYRSKRTMELLWHGTWSHAVEHKIDIMFGCASFEGIKPSPYASALAWLNENSKLPDDENCTPQSDNFIELARYANDNPNLREAMAAMPPLLKGYLRLGAQVGSQLVVDHQFGTTDILVVLKVARISPRYLAHFGADASRFSA